MRKMSMTARDEIVGALARRHAVGSRAEKTRILDEFSAIAGFHRKHAMRVLRAGTTRAPTEEGRAGRRIYDDAVREALVVLWEASDRICGKRLKALTPTLAEAMERHGHLRLGPEIRAALLAMSAATVDRSLAQGAGAGRRQTSAADGGAVVRAPENPGAHVLGLGRPAAGIRRGRPGRAQRPRDEGELRADAGPHRHGHGLDRVRAAAVPTPARRLALDALSVGEVLAGVAWCIRSGTKLNHSFSVRTPP